MTPISDAILTVPRRRPRNPDDEDARQAIANISARVASARPTDAQESEYLDPIWARVRGRVPCPVCLGSGRATQGYCECPNGDDARSSYEDRRRREREEERASYIESWDRILAKPPRIYTGALGTFPVISVRNKVKRFMTEWDWNQNLILHGPTGRGKTALMLSMALMLRDEATATFPTRNVRFISMTDLQAHLRAGMDSDRNGGLSYEQRIENLCKVNLLLCDDVGAERRTDWWPTPLYDILYERYNRGFPTWMTTNLSIDIKKGEVVGDLVPWFDDHGRLMSRLLQNGRIIPVTGRDLRMPTE
jgi:hypothetical protein